MIIIESGRCAYYVFYRKKKKQQTNKKIHSIPVWKYSFQSNFCEIIFDFAVKRRTLLLFCVVYRERIVTLQSVCRYDEWIAVFPHLVRVIVVLFTRKTFFKKCENSKKSEDRTFKNQRRKSEKSCTVGNNNILVFDSWCVRRSPKR